MLPLFPVPVVELDGKRPHRAPTSSAKLWLPLSQNGKRTKWNLSSKFNGSRACREFLTRGSELVLPSCSTRITEARMTTTGRALFAVRSPFCPITRSSPRFSGVWLNFGGVTSESIGIIDRYLSPRMEYRVIGGAVRYRSACTFPFSTFLTSEAFQLFTYEICKRKYALFSS